MFNINERVYNPRSQIQSVPHQVSMFHPQASQVIYPQPSMIHPQSYQMIHPQSYQVIHSQSSLVTHQQASQASAVSLQSSADPIQVDSSLVVPFFLLIGDPLECLNKALTFMSTILALSYLSSNNQLETSSNPMHQVAMPERQTLSYVGNCSTDNKSVNDTLTAELERYKEQVKVLKEGQNVEVTSRDNFSDSHEQNAKIDRLKQTLSKQLKEKESLMKIVTVLKNDFKKEESRNIDREITLEKKIKQLENIVYKRDQLVQTVHMLTKPKFFYDHSTKQALGFQNPFYLRKLSSLNQSFRMDPEVIAKKVNTTPVDYAALNKLSQDFEKQFVPQTELSTEQAFWSQNSMNSSDPSPSCRPTKVEVPKELPKVSMVNTSLKKLKHHLAGFDVVVKERTTTTTITEGSWGFEHTKACFRDEIIPFVKALKDIFNTFDQYLIDELSEVQNVFHQMEQAVEQHRLESKTFEVKMNQVLNENERLLEQVINKDIVNIIMNSSVDNAYVNVHECEKCLKLETELLNKKDFIEKETYDKLFRSFTTLEKHCISLEVDTQLNQEIFQRDNSVSNQSAPSFDQYFELNELKAQSQEKDTVIKKLKERIKSLSGNMNEDKTYKQLYDSIKPTRIRSKEQCDALIAQINAKSVENSDLNAQLQEKVFAITALKEELRKLKGKSVIACRDSMNKTKVIAPVVHKVDLEPLSPKLKNNREAHVDYIRITKENTDTLRDIVEQARTSNPLDNALAYACMYTKQIQELLVYFSDTCPSSPLKRVKPSTSASESQPLGNTKKDKIRQTPSST
ncbi:hypothetical protein Tco_0445480 [Tanacetum coccineum]